MLFPADYHMHTPLCRHAVGEPVELAARAVEVGLSEIGFSDHSPMPQDDFDDWRMPVSALDAYVANVEQARRSFPQLKILLALEVDYIPGQEEWIRDLAARHPWDYLIGSVHYVFDTQWAIDNPHRMAEWRNRSVAEIWSRYAERLVEAVESGFFDIIGHADLCKKFGFYPDGDSTELFVPFLKACQRRGVAMELNTAGLRKDCREIYPAPGIVRRAAELGVGITFGSDAHAPAEVGMGFANAVSVARQAGFTEWCRFDKRTRTSVTL
jgi:histidinol-phosphatase (PHP family)